MNPFKNFTLSLIALILVGDLILPGIYHHPVLDRDPKIDLVYKEEIESQPPDVVFIGNSVLERGLDVPLFDQLSELKSLEIAYNGSGTALWYLLLKNEIAVANPAPRYVAIVFQDYIFISPRARPLGSNLETIERFAGADEDILDELAYFEDLSSLERVLLRSYSYYLYRDCLRESMLGFAKYPVIRSLFSVDQEMVDASVNAVFAVENMDPILFLLWQVGLEEGEVKSDQGLFLNNVENTFLPYMLEIANQHGIALIFLSYRSRPYTYSDQSSPELRTFFQDMAKYVTDH